jgi:DnaJ-class molecular chaperone
MLQEINQLLLKYQQLYEELNSSTSTDVGNKNAVKGNAIAAFLEDLKELTSCPTCDGEGRIRSEHSCEFCGYDYECEDCDGTGKRLDK